MSKTTKSKLSGIISAKAMKEVDHWIAKYPAEERQSAVMAALSIVQEEMGSLNQDSMDAVAEYLDMPAIAVYEVASFYTMYQQKPVGKHLINVCASISCYLCDCNSVIKHLEKKLDIKMGETTKDGRFTLRSVECLGACVNAPMMQIDKDYHEKLTAEKIDTVLEQYS